MLDSGRYQANTFPQPSPPFPLITFVHSLRETQSAVRPRASFIMVSSDTTVACLGARTPEGKFATVEGEDEVSTDVEEEALK